MIRSGRGVLIVLVCLGVMSMMAEGGKPKQKGLIPGSIATFLDNSNEQLMLYYDFDRDKRADFLTKSYNVETQQAYVNIYLWVQTDKVYRLSGSFKIDNYLTLTTVMASSFAVYDKFRLILYSQDVEGKGKIEVRPFECVDYQCSYSLLETKVVAESVDWVKPTLISYQGKPCIMYQKNGTIELVSFTAVGFSVVDFKDVAGQSARYLYSFNGDYDGDCQTDLVLLSKNSSGSVLTFYQGKQMNVYSLKMTKLFTEDIVHFAILDINFDGQNDLILLLSTGDLQIHYNKNTATDSLCVGTEDPYDFVISSTQVKQIQRVNLGSQPIEEAVLLFGDYNNDAYDDLAVTLNSGDNPKAILFQNVACLDSQCGTYNPVFIAESSTRNLQTFTAVPLDNMPDVINSLSFLDFYQDGNLDLIANVQKINSEGKRYLTIQAVYNNVGYDAFFLTLTLMTYRNRVAYLDNTEYIGGVGSFYVSLLSGELAPKTGNQMSQVGSTLQLPFIRYGLGRTNNYLTFLTIHLPRAVTATNLDLINFEWTSIIPNSDILIIPPSHSSQTIISSAWHLQVLIEPTEKMLLVCFFVVATLVIMGIVIIRLNKKEVLEDQEDDKYFRTIFA